MENPVARNLAVPPKSAFCVHVSCARLLVKPAASKIAIMRVFVFMMFSSTEWNYLITLSVFISLIVIVGGISPFLIFSITSRATLVTSSFVLNRSWQPMAALQCGRIDVAAVDKTADIDVVKEVGRIHGLSIVCPDLCEVG